MRYLFILLFFPVCLSAQESAKSVQYSVDSIRIDSFYLIEKTISTGTARPDTAIRYTLFSDTTAFRKYINLQKRVAKGRKNEWQHIKLEWDSLDARVGRLEDLAAEKFAFTFGNSNRAAPAPETPQAGFWVMYPVRGNARTEYVTSIEQIKSDAIVLRQNGTTFEYKKPKKKKK